jgi:ribonuclease III
VSISAPIPGEKAPDGASDDLAQKMGHAFTRPALLTEALTHPSVIEAQRLPKKARRDRAPLHYQRLEFLGDRVLGLVIAETLWRRYPREPEGHLTRRLSELVRREALARVALDIGLDRHLILSPSDVAAGAARNPSILADVCEAVIAAIYLDGGLPAAAAFIAGWWEKLINENPAPPRDPKTRLQEWALSKGLGLPAYRLVATEGPEHALRFTVAARVAESDEASATASSKRAAETDAAAALLALLIHDG